MNFDQLAPELNQYEFARDLTLKPTKNIQNFSPAEGIFVTKRDGAGHPVEALIRVLADNPHDQIEVIGEFNNWGRGEKVFLHPDSDPQYFVGHLKNIFHGMQYLLV